MKGLLILSIFVFSFLITEKNKKPLKALLISLSFAFAPVIMLSEISPQILISFLFFLFLFFLLSNFEKNSITRKILFYIIIFFTILTTLYLSGILNGKLLIESKNIYVFNFSNIEKIRKFQSEATYLPTILRPLIYNYSEIIYEVLVRSFYFISLNKIITFFGFSFIYLIYLALSVKKNFHIFLIPLIILLIIPQSILFNSQYLYLLSIPSLLFIFNKNINKINIPVLLLTILISYIYSFL